MSGHCRTANAVPSGRRKRRQRLQLDGRSRIEEVGNNEPLGSMQKRRSGEAIIVLILHPVLVA